MIDHQSVNSM